MKNYKISRRKFISTGVITLSGITLGLPALGKSLANHNVIRVGVIGTGSRGLGLAVTMKKVPELQLVACCDLLPRNLANGMKEAVKGAKAYTDYQKLLDDKNIDAVIIATPLHLHYPMAIDALSAGKHVYLEKSLAYDIPKAMDLVQKVRQKPELTFQVGYQYRNYGLYQRIKEVIDKGWIGKVTQFESQFNTFSDWRQPNNDPKLERLINWRMYREYCGGPLSELCAHQIDMVNYLTGARPQKVSASGGINYWKDGRETHDHIRAIYDYPDGVQSIATSVLSNSHRGYNMRILGDKATIEVTRNQAFVYPLPAKKVRGIVDGVTGATLVTKDSEVNELTYGDPSEKRQDPTVDALLDFSTCIREKKKPLSNIETAYDGAVAIQMGVLAADNQTIEVWKPEYSI